MRFERTPTYNSWRAMIDRCTQAGHTKWADYGGRGISVCERWSSYVSFVEDMGERPSLEHSIERLDNEGGYDPLNCVWADRMQQASNKRNNVWLEIGGERKTLAQWGRSSGILAHTIARRVAAGWADEHLLLKERPVCKRGHELSGHNLGVHQKGSWFCRKCSNLSARNRRARTAGAL